MKITDDIYSKIGAVDAAFLARLHGPPCRALHSFAAKQSPLIAFESVAFQAHDFRFNSRKPQTLSWGPGGSTDAFHKLKQKVRKAPKLIQTQPSENYGVPVSDGLLRGSHTKSGNC